ncbi:MAG: DUF4249 family protein [Flavobacteriales bacterium]|jgi:hypothetical protein
MKKILFLFAAIISLASCETDVDLNAPYKSTTVVYGLLDPIQDTQWIKINRTFLGDGNNLDYASIRDSNEYKLDEFNSLTVTELVDGDVSNTFNLTAIEISNKSINGIFYGPTQTVFYFVKPGGLNQDARYRLNLDFKDREDVSAETAMVRPADVSFFNEIAIATLGREIRLASVSTSSTFSFETYNGSFFPDESAPFYEVALRMRFKEKTYSDASHTVLLSERPITVEYNAGTFTKDNTASNGRINFSISGEGFFNVLSTTLKSDDNIVYEIGEVDDLPFPGTEAFDLVLYIGGDELYTFFQVNSPTTGVVQERPTYSNIRNGLGLFSSRSSRGIFGLPIATTNPGLVPNFANLLALRFSNQTQNITFCDPGGESTDIIPLCP